MWGAVRKSVVEERASPVTRRGKPRRPLVGEDPAGCSFVVVQTAPRQHNDLTCLLLRTT